MSHQVSSLTDLLRQLRAQGMQLSDINPISALADTLSDDLYHGQLTTEMISTILDELSGDIWQQQAKALAVRTGIDTPALDALQTHQAQFADLPLDKPLYRAVFTAHPVFALQRSQSDALCEAAEAVAQDKPVQPPANAYLPRKTVSLDDEHEEAMQALIHARQAIGKINQFILAARAKSQPDRWYLTLPQMLGVSSWVGYDMDGRADITWIDALTLRLREKHMALGLYRTALKEILGKAKDAESASNLSEELAAIDNLLAVEEQACSDDLHRLSQIAVDTDAFAEAANCLTERQDKLIHSQQLASRLHDIVKQAPTSELAMPLMLLAGDIATHGFGMGEIHLRINAVQLRNAMRSVDGRSLSVSDGGESHRLLMDRLAKRIASEAPWQINFANVDQETATARRQLMLAAQFLKHVDADQPIRLLIAECERPITYMSALYLAHKMGIADQLDISPLFETTFGLEHGVEMMNQLFRHDVVQRYIRQRGRVAIQLGFSDAGRFMGQIAANMAIERLQIKMTELMAETFSSDIDLLLFNTHGESLGRGCARPQMKQRQDFIMTPFVRDRAQRLGIRIYHQSSFQGGDGYRCFGTPALAMASMTQLLLAETAPVSAGWTDDPFYSQHDFSLDLFLNLKNWHETLFADPQYGATLDVFGANLLPKTGSRPSKRVVQAGNERSDPSKIRAIPHNAILQQLGFLAIVVSGIGSAARIDTDRFAEMYHHSPRLQQVMSHVQQAKQLGSLNTMLAYARLTDNGFWIGRAYHGTQMDNQRAFRHLAEHLRQSGYAVSIRQTAWKLREDLIDLYRLSDLLSINADRTTGDERLMPDLLHALRLMLISDSLIRVSQVPRFAESNRHSNADLMAAAIKLDFDTVCMIVEQEFPDMGHDDKPVLAEAESYSTASTASYSQTRARILQPIRDNQQLIKQITQMISALYGAHG